MSASSAKAGFDSMRNRLLSLVENRHAASRRSSHAIRGGVSRAMQKARSTGV